MDRGQEWTNVKRNKLLISLSIFATCSVVLVTFGGARSSVAAGLAAIKVGLDIPYSGTDQFEGHHYYQAAQLFFDRVNKMGGLDGHKFQYILGDNQCDPGVGVNSARKLLAQDKVDVMVGSACSSVTLAVMPLLKQFKVPEIDATATNPTISQESGVGGNIWKFRLNLNDGLMDTVFAKKVLAPAAKTLALFAVNTDYGRAAVSLFQTALSDAGSKVVDVLY
jgi:branched-chain amino acid transport system substrate-binding protein